MGDDTTDIDAFRGLGELVELGSLKRALRVGVRSRRDARRSSRPRPT